MHVLGWYYYGPIMHCFTSNSACTKTLGASKCHNDTNCVDGGGIATTANTQDILVAVHNTNLYGTDLAHNY